MANGRGNSKLVTVFGGSGFIGRHTVRALARDGWRIRAAVRRPDLAGHLQPMGGVGQIQAVQANVRYPDSIAAALEGADAVINLVGILAESGRQNFKAVHSDGARAIARAAAEAGVKQLVHVSAIGAGEKSRSNYGRSKAAGEAAVLDAFPNAVIVRPSIVFGPEDDFFNRFGDMARLSPVLPLIGGGKTKFQPIYVGDVAAAITSALDGNAEPGTVYELGGPATYSFRDLMAKVCEYSGRNRARISVPFWIASTMAWFTKILPSPPLTNDQVRLLKSDNVVSTDAIESGHTLDALGISSPASLEAIVPAYMERFKPKGQYAHYRV